MIKNHLSQLMGKKRISIRAVAKVTNMSATTISKMYNEKSTRIDYDTIDKLCKLFNCNVQDLLEYIPN